MRLIKALLLIVLCVGFAMPASAQRKVALIVGIPNYVQQNELHNPGNDARLIEQTLRSKGFEIYGNAPQINLTLSRFQAAVRDFTRFAQNADVALFYYSGHGSASGSVNYLAANDTGAVSSIQLMQSMGETNARLKIVLLDACRTETRQSGGLVQMTAPHGTIIGFAAQPGANASDGAVGTNSPYAAALARRMNQPGADHFTVINQAGVDVALRTGWQQVPWMHASAIVGNFYFTPPVYASANPQALASIAAVIPPASQVQSTLPPVPAVVVSNGSASSFTQAAWKSFDQENDPMRYANARKILNDGLANDPTSALSYSYGGYAWFKEGDMVRDQILRTVPRSDRASQLAPLLKAYYAPAFIQLDRAINLNKTFSSFFAHRGNAVMGVFHTRVAAGLSVDGTMDRAITDLEMAVKTDPSSMLAANDLGTAYLLRQRYQDAEAAFQNALKINPRYVAPWDGLCRVYLKTRRPGEAKKAADYAASRSTEFTSKSCLQ